VTSAPAAKTTSAFAMPLVLWLVGLSLFIALVATHGALALLCALVFATMLGAKAWSRASLARLRSELQVDRRKLFPGEALALAVAVDNRKLLPIWLQVSLPSALGLRCAEGRSQLQRDCGLFAYQRVTFDWQLTAARRGVHRIGPLELEAADPLGFFPRKTSAAAFEIVVYPRLVALNTLLLPRRDVFGQAAVRGLIEDPAYVQGIREYQPGRAARYIHWKASARHSRLLEKTCEATEQARVLLVIHAERFADDPSGECFERSLEVVASLAAALEQRRCSVGLMTNCRVHGGGSGAVPIARKPGQLSTLLETLARLEPAPTVDLLDALGNGPALSWTVTVICFSYALDASSAALIELLKRRKIPAVRVVCDPDGAETNSAERVYRLADVRAEAAPLMAAALRERSL
jgi:uncharacterized protein (DUF58 family)